MNEEELRLLSDKGVEMKIEGEWFTVRLTTRAGRMAARMWAYTAVSDDERNDPLAKAVLDYVGREELQKDA